MNFNNSQEKLHICEVCCKRFSYRSQMKQHLKTHRKKKSFVSGRIYSPKICNKDEKLITFSPSVLKKSPTAEICFEKSSTKGSPKGKPFICKRRFSSKFNLKQHLKTNAEKKSFICDICKKKLSSKHSLFRHIKIHAEGKHEPFICNICERKYSSADCLH